ncbi:hypothetical protein HBO32_29845 [Pseudomonas nitroreducens]|uniref:hypothetical protein n=1 Tax=Pseudomonas nitroreducens TaxID=46680 RepID=UPI0014767926|nr:hypothetical protein [Pseudomonas nitroreducens]NMZ77304.1 hypothetical protein [Pseudomonas nitroreducens]
MLADDGVVQVQSGMIGQGVHLASASLYALIDFIADELPKWRDRSDRRSESAETVLTSQLCAHMNSASRKSSWDFLQFRTEEPDESVAGRKIDLVPAPCGCTVWIDGRRHTDFDPLLPIECKRLPIPAGIKRDKLEYLYSRYSSTGGVDRFKAGRHGAAHMLGAMIGFIQEGAIAPWEKKMDLWTKALVRAKVGGWQKTDKITLHDHDSVRKLGVLKSSHVRNAGLADIELRHLWVEMN